MTKRIVIAGSRDYNNYTQAKEFIDSVLNPIQAENKIIIVSGGHRDPPLRYRIKFSAYYGCRLLWNNIRFAENSHLNNCDKTLIFVVL